MKSAFPKYIVFITVLMILCSGCKNNSIIAENIIADSIISEQSDNEAIAYKNGRILLKDNKKYDYTSGKSVNNPKIELGEIEFEPKEINFEN